jgi:DNA anti-recombination protein RmuC
MALDTLTIVRRLEAARIDRQQAEAIADVLRESEAGALADLATKADLREIRADLMQVKDGLRSEMGALEQRLQGEINALRAEMESRFDKVDARFESLEQRMTIKLGSMIVVALGVMAVLVRLL